MADSASVDSRMPRYSHFATPGGVESVWLGESGGSQMHAASEVSASSALHNSFQFRTAEVLADMLLLLNGPEFFSSNMSFLKSMLPVVEVDFCANQRALLRQRAHWLSSAGCSLPLAMLLTADV